MIFTACIVAAGRGERAGGVIPKQFQILSGKPMLAWSVEQFARRPDCSEIIIAHGPGQADDVLGCCKDIKIKLVEGGQSRTASVRNAVALASEPRIMIHDAARPLLSQSLIDRLNAALDQADGAAPALAVTDALVRRHESGAEAVNREGLYRIQTPQTFHTEALRQALKTTSDDFPDEVSLARFANLSIDFVDGDDANFKVTYPDDFARAEAMLKPKNTTLTVTGSGYDVHRMASGEGVYLCGVFIPCSYHLVGHSDADAGLHAITDAVLGAAGLGDIGDHFPPSDDQWKGADSVLFLRHALKLAQSEGVIPVHVDVTLICEKPKIGPHKSAMKTRVADILGLPTARVNIKATTTEKLGFTGRGEGLAAEAVVTAVTTQ